MKFYYLSFLVASCSTAVVLGHFDPNCVGERKTIVHLFEWRWNDIAAECEHFLGPKGYCGVQVSPPNEHRVIVTEKMRRPWFERYQPVSYKLYSRSGDEGAFIDMVKRCNKANVRIYVDVVMNHMVNQDAGRGNGIAGGYFNTNDLSFPDAGYTRRDFNERGYQCKSESGFIENFYDPIQIRNCRLNGLLDLNQGEPWVRQTLASWMNHLIGMGVAGFRFDAAKHMWPADLQLIVRSLTTLRSDYFPVGAKPFIYQDVLDLAGETIRSSEYFSYARVTEFNYGKYLSEMFTGQGQLSKLKTFAGGYLWGYLMPSDKAVVFIDNHDNQRSNNAILNFFSPRQYKMAVTFMLAWPYGVPQVMSSYQWVRDIVDGKDRNDWMGPPHDRNWATLPVWIHQHGTNSTTCGLQWVCEHRWPPIANMVAFRNVAGNDSVTNWWDDSNNQIAFSRGSRAFYAVNSGRHNMSAEIQTGMKPGRYCDVISGEKTSANSCSGKTITVDEKGFARIFISASYDEPMVAIHLESMLDGPDTKPTLPPVEGFKRTVVFMKYETNITTDQLFLRGGIATARRPICEASYQACWVPINYGHVKYESEHYAAYNFWSKGDEYLDWLGGEPTQGIYLNRRPEGSPLVQTSDLSGSGDFNGLNTYGPNYWMLDVEMDCSATYNGWFEVKAILNGNEYWESHIAQDNVCNGKAGISTPFASQNHIARCGYKNVFAINENSCHIDTF